jgi:hypothetical protein
MTYRFERSVGPIVLRYELTFDATCPVECARFEGLRREWEDSSPPAPFASPHSVAVLREVIGVLRRGEELKNLTRVTEELSKLCDSLDGIP